MSDRPPNNLPAQLTTFVGRELELAQLCSILPTAPLVTLTGVGGGGKTRLALQAAAGLVDQFPDGLWFVELGALPRVELLPSAVASVLGIREEPGSPLRELVLAHLRTRSALIVLDNCEHLLAACAGLANSITRDCHGVRVLATSRVPLGVPGEWVRRVPSLDAPAGGPTFDPEQLLDYDSVRLFVDRARAAIGQFRLTDENAPAVARICRLLDGIPLAIELAAARTTVLTAQQIAARLDDRFGLLQGGARTMPPRHRTLRAAVDWSYDLLSAPERELFCGLSVFSGGSTIDAVERVCAGQDADAAEVLDLLSRLVDHSLVHVDHRGEQARYLLLETLREYGADKLFEDNSQAALRDRHLDWCLSFAERALPEWDGAGQRAWLNRFDAEHDNLRAALGWTQSAGRGEEGLRLAVAVSRFWQVRGHFDEGRSWLDEALEAAPGAPPALRDDALRMAGTLALELGDIRAARTRLEAAIAISRERGDGTGIITSSRLMASVAVREGNYEEALGLLEEALRMTRELASEPDLARALASTGAVAADQGDHVRARALFEEAIEIARRLGDDWRLALWLINLGYVERIIGHPDAARSLLEESLALSHGLGDVTTTALSQLFLGTVLAEAGDSTQARTMFEDSLRSARGFGAGHLVVGALIGVGTLDAKQGDFVSAETRLEEAVAVARGSGDPALAVDAVRALGSMLGARGDTARARALCEEAVRSSRDLGLPLPAAESLRDLGALLVESADHRAARSCIEEGASIMARIGARRGLLEFQVLDARLAHATGELARGRAMCEEVVAAASSLRDPSLAATAVHVLGKIALAGGDAQEAEAHARDALARRLDLGERPGVAGCLETLALAAAERGAADVAVRLHGAVARVREDMRAAPARDGDEPSRLRDRLGAAAFSRAWDEGYAAGEQAASHDTGEPWPVETAPEVSAAPGPPQPARQCFRREGEYWTIAFHGSVCRLKDTKGLRYIAELLRRPGRDVHVLELVGESIAGRLGGPAPDDLGVRAGLGDAGALLDPQAKAAYRRRLAELEEEAQDAESLQDLERAERARNEIDAIARALAAAVGLGGRDRRAASAAERARSNATKAIKAALTRIAEECPEAGQHLSRSIRTGQYCSYTPEAGRPGWEV